ncbi:ABC transporter ATP-binding protein [Xanthomonas campestris pv. raphani]|nr:ABC transporter ATP-binding protein [Xanthomonas campestris pv. raphani]QLC71937.1 ABC transporter ATP-binding protein [Xanthomonas campestris pv. raphani]WDJ20283.1 ABC transporter ATP-binding protein [Xanthomonas campestris pv. raphani]
MPTSSTSTVSPAAEILAAYVKSDRRLLLCVVVVVGVASVTTVAAPLLFSRLIDRLPQQGAAALVWAFVAYGALLGLAAALQQMVQYLSFMSSENLGFITSTRYFAAILKKTTAFFVEHNPAEIQAAGERGRSGLKILVQLALVAFVPGVLQILLSLWTLGALIDLQLVLVVVLYGAAAIGLSTIATRRARVHLESATNAGQENARFVGNVMNAMETLRQFGSHAWMSQRFEQRAQLVRDHWRAYVLQRLRYIALLGLGLAIQFAITFQLLLPRYYAGAVSVGDLVLFNLLLLQLNTPFEAIARAIDDVARARAMLVPLVTLWRAPEEPRLQDAQRFIPSDGRIVFDAVHYRYDNGRGVAGVSFSAERGSMTFLMGDTGAGKSTLFKLALKSIEPDTGRILIDGVNLAHIDRANWHACVAVVPQDVVLLNETLADNILLGRPRNEARLREVVTNAAILPLIDALPRGLDTAVGERGLKLSGGERQRIAIARALYGNPAILLLDEAGSALDEGTQHVVMAHLRALAGRVTVLAITHRRGGMTPTDRVIWLAGDRNTAHGPVDVA